MKKWRIINIVLPISVVTTFCLISIVLATYLYIILSLVLWVVLYRLLFVHLPSFYFGH
jgi:hypothetical protein